MQATVERQLARLATEHSFLTILISDLFRRSVVRAEVAVFSQVQMNLHAPVAASQAAHDCEPVLRHFCPTMFGNASARGMRQTPAARFGRVTAVRGGLTQVRLSWRRLGQFSVWLAQLPGQLHEAEVRLYPSPALRRGCPLASSQRQTAVGEGLALVGFVRFLTRVVVRLRAEERPFIEPVGAVERPDVLSVRV